MGAHGAAMREAGTGKVVAGDYRFLLGLVRPYRNALLFALVLMLLQSLVTLVNPWLAGRFSTALLQHDAVNGLLLAWFAVVATQSVLGYAVGIHLQKTTADLIADTSARVFDHLQSLPLQWHQERRRGDVLSLLTRDVSHLGYFATQSITPVLPQVLICAGALAMMLRIQPWFGIGAAVLVAVVSIAMRWVGRQLRPLGNAATEAYARRSAIAEQNLAMLPIVKAFIGEARESSRFVAQARALRDIEVTQARWHGLVGPATSVFSAAAVLAMLWLASRQVTAGTLQAGDLVSLLLYGLLLTQPMSALAGMYGQVQSARGTAQRLIGVFHERPEPADGAYEAHAARGAIEFAGVEFTHAGRAPVLRGIDLRVAAGETVAIIGENGAGKSTLVHLLLRFADPDAGSIRLDGRDLREFSLRSLRAQIGLVSQNVLLFNASVRENIAYGRADADAVEVERAARAARAHDFIMRLPQGYDTPVGDQGIRLSGGQKQRIALARALLKDPAVLILDEATAMFDPTGESEFIEECRHLLRQRTVLLITHRPASLALADRVVRLSEGRLTGSPETPSEEAGGRVDGQVAPGCAGPKTNA